ncbi:MAG: IS21 family transposase [Firmicutes bacterium]|nr:IS21 family transposase [Bacillota bacterium]
MEIRQLREQGLYYKQIAERLDIDPRTVAKHCKGEPVKEKTHKRPGVLSGFEDYIIQRMTQGVTNSMVILREIRAQGYRGGKTVLREFMAPLRKGFRNTPTIRYETEPGEQAQVDWGEFGTIMHEGKRRKLHCFVMTLGYSRYMYAEFTVSEALPCLVSCHERAFQYFGGFPKKVLYDNMATVVIRHPDSGEKVIHPRFDEFARMLGFSAQFCRVRRAQTKGDASDYTPFRL